jgi:hypothetical protein
MGSDEENKDAGGQDEKRRSTPARHFGYTRATSIETRLDNMPLSIASPLLSATRSCIFNLSCSRFDASRALSIASPSSSPPPSSSRLYHYDLSSHGQLFLSSTPHKTFTSSYKDPAFLSLFWRRLRPLSSSPTPSPPMAVSGENTQEREAWEEEALREGYRWVSECMGERNLLRTEPGIETPLVFDELRQQTSSSDFVSSSQQEAQPSSSSYTLHLLGTSPTSPGIPFSSSSLAVSPSTGHIYHALPLDSRWRSQLGVSAGSWGLVGGKVVVEGLGGKIREGLESEEGWFWWEGKRGRLGVLDEDIGS